MRALKDRDQATAAKVAKAMVSVLPAGDVLRAVAGAKEAGGGGPEGISSHMLLQLDPPRAPQGPHLAGLVRPERRPARVRARIGTRSSSNARVLAAHLAAPGRARADPAAVVARVASVAPATVVAARRREGPCFRDLRPPPLDREPGPVKPAAVRLDGLENLLVRS